MRRADLKEASNHYSQMSNSLSDGLHDTQPQMTNGSVAQAPGDDDDDVILKSFRGGKKHQR
jgi:hypothetical protein